MGSVSRSANARRSLNVEFLEERTNPATGVYSAGTLTITPTTGDTITVGLKPAFLTPGFLEVDDGAVVFFSSNGNENVRNIVVKGNAASAFSFILESSTDLNNLSINGARITTNVTLNPSFIAGALTFHGTGVANDTIHINATAYIGQSATLNLGAGDNTVDLDGLVVGKDLTINGKEGLDLITVALNSQVKIGGNWNLALGNGMNGVVGMAAQTVWVGKNLNYSGGSGQDGLNFNLNSTTLVVGGNFKFVANGGGATIFDFADFANLTVGSNVNYVGSPANDRLYLGGPTVIGGNVSMLGNAGVNRCSVFNTTVGGQFSFVGTIGTDSVEVNLSTIGKNMSLAVGDNDFSGAVVGIIQEVALGNMVSNGIGGSLRITSGKQADVITVQRTRVGGALTISTGDESDTLTIDDITVNGTALIDLGRGNDSVMIDTGGFFYFGSSTNFAKDLTIKAGAGEDLVVLCSIVGTRINFGGKVKLSGGLDSDTLQNYITNYFVLPLGMSTEDFEVGDF